MTKLCTLIIPFDNDRITNLDQTLKFFSFEDISKETELILICQSEHQDVEFMDFHSTKVISMNSEFYCRSKMCNIGVLNASSDNIILLDSDRVLPKNYFTNVISFLEEDMCVTTKNLWKANYPLSEDEIISGSYEASEDFRSETNEFHKKNMFSGNTVLKRKLYFEAGMMDESYVGYGYQDLDFTQKMMSLNKKMVFLEDKEIHLWHEKKIASEEVRKQTIMNAIKFCKKWNLKPNETVVELGQEVGIDVLSLVDLD